MRARNESLMKTLYLDCFAGISGDMTVAALLNLGVDLAGLRQELKKIGVKGYVLKTTFFQKPLLTVTGKNY